MRSRWYSTAAQALSEMFALLRCAEMPEEEGAGAVMLPTPAMIDWSMTIFADGPLLRVGDLGETFHGSGVERAQPGIRPSTRCDSSSVMRLQRLGPIAARDRMVVTYAQAHGADRPGGSHSPAWLEALPQRGLGVPFHSPSGRSMR